METYTLLRHIADSWFLLAMFAFFVGAILFIMRPGSRQAHDEAASVVFRNEDAPAPNPDPVHPKKEVRA